MRMQVKVKMNKTITILILVSTFLLTTIIFLSFSLLSPSLVKSGVVSDSSVTTFKTGTEPETKQVPTNTNTTTATTNTNIPKYQEAKHAEEAQKENNTTKHHFDVNKKGPSAVHENNKLQKEKGPAGISSQDLNAAKERLRRPRANSDHLSDKDKVVLPKGTDESFLRARMLERRERTKKDEKEAESDYDGAEEEEDDFNFLMSTPKNEENKHENTTIPKSPASVTASNKRPPSPQSSPKSAVGLSKKSSAAPTSLLEQIKSKRENLKPVDNNRNANTNTNPNPNPNTTSQASTKVDEVVNVNDERGAHTNANVGMFKGESIEKMIKQSKSYKNTDLADSDDDEWQKTSIIFFIVFVLLLIFGTVSYIIINKSKPESENLTEASTETEKNLTEAATTENTDRSIQEKLQIKEAPLPYTYNETLSWLSSMESDSKPEPENTVFEYPSKNHVSNTDIKYASASDIDSDSYQKSNNENEINRKVYQDPENTGSIGIVESDTKTTLSNDSTGAIEGQDHEQQENGFTNEQQYQNELQGGISSIEQPAQEPAVPETLETEENIPEALSDSISTVDGVIKNEETDPSKINFVADPVILSVNNGFVSYRRGMVSNVPYDKLDVEPPNYIRVTTTQYGNDQFSNRFDRAVILTFSHLNSIKDPKDHKRTPLEEMLQLKTKFEDITEDNVKYQMYIKVEPTGHFGYKSITELQYYDFVKSKLANIFSDRGIGAEIAKIILPNFGGNAEILVTMKSNQLTKEDSSVELEVASEHSGCVYDVALTPELEMQSVKSDSEIEAHTDSDGGSKVVTEQLHPPEIENAEEFNTDNDLSDLTSSLMGDLAVESESEDIDNDHLGDPSDVSKVVVSEESNNKSTEEKKKNELLEGNESSEEILLQKSIVAAVENETLPTDENTLNLKENNGSISNTAHSKRSSEDEGVSVIKLQSESESESENEKNSSDELDEQSNERNEKDNIYDTNISEEINSTETAKEQKEHVTSTETESEEKSEISDVNTVNINTVVPTETETDSKTDEVNEGSLSEKVAHNDDENLGLNAKEVTIDTTNKIFHDHISYGRGVYSNETEGSNYINVKTVYYDGTDDNFDRALFLTFTHSDKYRESQTEEQQFQKLKSETIKCFVNTIESKDDDCDYSVYSKVTPTGIWSNYKSIDEKQYFEILKKYLPELMLSHKVGETIGREILEKFGGDVGIYVERKKRSKD